jgi:hypothetical protein
MIGYRKFADGTRRPIYLDAKGLFVWLIPEEECCDPASDRGTVTFPRRAS